MGEARWIATRMASWRRGRHRGLRGGNMIVAVGGLVHEANAFAPPSTPADVIVIPPEKMLRAFAGTSTEISGFLDAAEGEIDREDLVPLGFAYGESGGMLDDDVALALCTDLVDRAEATRPDVVLLALHGSMATPVFPLDVLEWSP